MVTSQCRTNNCWRATGLICSRHFQPTYLKVTAKNLTRLIYHLDNITTIHPESIHKCQASVPTKSHQPPKDRIFQLDKISILEEKFGIRQFLDELNSADKP